MPVLLIGNAQRRRWLDLFGRCPRRRALASRRARRPCTCTSPLQAQTAEREARRAAEHAFYAAPMQTEATGTSAVQVFRGEDRARADRVKKQHAQMRNWSAAQAEAAQAEAQRRTDADADYHKYLMRVRLARLCAVFTAGQEALTHLTSP